MIYSHQSQLKTLRAFGAVGAGLASVLASASPLLAQTNSTSKLEKENQELRQRLDAVEDLLKKEGLKPSDRAADPPVGAMTDISLSGFVTTSYFYDIANSKDKAPTAYLWNTKLNNFTLNKVKLTLASPAVAKDKWDAAYRVSLMFGQDAPFVNSGGYGAGAVPGFQDIREAYVELNAPVGTGLDLRAGELISLLNYESGDGGAVNDNFSQGYQWWYTGNGPAAGVQAGYDFNDKVGIKLRLQNGLYTGPSDSGPKTFMGGLYYKPDDKTSLAFLGFAGRQNYHIPASSYLWGGSIIGTRKLTEKDNLSFATELDYFNYSFLTSPVKNGDFWSVGGWLTGDLCPKSTWALRVDFVSDPTGFGTGNNSPNPSGPGTAFPATIWPGGFNQELSSVTFTLNLKPSANIKIQPEVRWNHSTASGTLNGKSDQLIVGVGASYIF